MSQTITTEQATYDVPRKDEAGGCRNQGAVIVTELRNGNGVWKTKAISYYNDKAAAQAYRDLFHLSGDGAECPEDLAGLLDWQAERVAAHVEALTLAEALDYLNDPRFGVRYFEAQPNVLRAMLALGWIEVIAGERAQSVAE